MQRAAVDGLTRTSPRGRTLQRVCPWPARFPQGLWKTHAGVAVKVAISSPSSQCALLRLMPQDTDISYIIVFFSARRRASRGKLTEWPLSGVPRPPARGRGGARCPSVP